MKELITNRLVLRAFVLTDLDDFYNYAKNPIVGPMAGWKPHETKEDTLVILKSFIKKQEVWAVCLKETGQVIGSVGVHKKSVKPIYELGYVLAIEHWGKGLICEACSVIIDYVFKELGVEELIVEHFVSNTQSRRVIEKLGFTYQKEVKHCYTMYNGVKHDCRRYIIERREV